MPDLSPNRLTGSVGFRCNRDVCVASLPPEPRWRLTLSLAYLSRVYVLLERNQPEGFPTDNCWFENGFNEMFRPLPVEFYLVMIIAKLGDWSQDQILCGERRNGSFN